MAPQSEWTLAELKVIVEKLNQVFLVLVGMGISLHPATIARYLAVSCKYRSAIRRSKTWD